MTCHLLQYRIIGVFLFWAVSNWAFAQESRKPIRLETEQLLNYYRSLKNSSQELLLSSVPHDGKCGFWISAQVFDRWKQLSLSQRAEFSVLMQPGSRQRDTVIGRFRISFDTSGVHTPHMLISGNTIPNSWREYVILVGKVFNHVWDVEVDQMGYTAPPFESGQSCYNIYVEELSGTEYGETVRSEPINITSLPYLYHSYIKIDNDYSEFVSRGINGLEVTAAHEFHHAIQIGAYGEWPDDLYAYEITSTWFEDVLYTDVNDYYQYLKDYFGNSNGISGFWQGWPFNSGNYGGYERCIWAHFLAKRFHTPDVMRGVWERMKTQPFLESTNAELTTRGSNLESAFAEFTHWNYFTADRADTAIYYPEGNNYPRFQPLQKIVYTNGDVTVGGDVSPLSSSMYEFDLSSSDTLTAMIANVDVNAAELRQTLTTRVDATLFSQNYPPPYHQFENGLKARIIVADTSLWHDFFSQSSIFEYVLKRLSNLAPNPFHINNDQQLFLPVNEDEIGLANVYFYSSSLSLVYTAEVNITYEIKSMVIAIRGSDLKSKLSSGVYFVIAKTKKKDYQWKVSVIQ